MIPHWSPSSVTLDFHITVAKALSDLLSSPRHSCWTRLYKPQEPDSCTEPRADTPEFWGPRWHTIEELLSVGENKKSNVDPLKYSRKLITASDWPCVTLIKLKSSLLTYIIRTEVKIGLHSSLLPVFNHKGIKYSNKHFLQREGLDHSS